MLPARATRQIIALSALIAILALPTCFGPNFFTNVHTRHCPVTHQFSAGAACVVLDDDGTRTLIQHANLDRKVQYLELRRAGDELSFRIPESVTVLAPMGYTARLVPGRDDVVRLNGEVVRLVPGPPSWR